MAPSWSRGYDGIGGDVVFEPKLVSCSILGGYVCCIVQACFVRVVDEFGWLRSKSQRGSRVGGAQAFRQRSDE